MSPVVQSSPSSGDLDRPAPIHLAYHESFPAEPLKASLDWAPRWPAAGEFEPQLFLVTACTSNIDHNQPSRPRRHFCGLFSRSESPSPSPAPRLEQTDNEAAFAANHSQEQHASPTAPEESPKPASSGPPVVTSKDTPQITIAEVATVEVPAAKITVAKPPPDVEDDSTVSADLPGSAYQKALASFSQDDREKLTSQETIRSLFEQLNEADLAHQEHSLLRKGLMKVKPYLEFLNVTIDFVSLFASVEPAAGTALGVVKTAASVSSNHSAPCR